MKHNKLFPTNLPYSIDSYTYIPKDSMDIYLKMKDLRDNDFLFLCAYYLDESKSEPGRKERMLELCRRSRTTEWRRMKRLRRLELI